MIKATRIDSEQIELRWARFEVRLIGNVALILNATYPSDLLHDQDPQKCPELIQIFRYLHHRKCDINLDVSE